MVELLKGRTKGYPTNWAAATRDNKESSLKELS